MGNLSAAASVDALACREVVELVTDYLEAALSPVDHARFDQHIAGCEGCQYYLRQMRQTIRMCAALTGESIPVTARQELLERFQNWKVDDGDRA